ncbi:MAG: hypothetical protein O2820_09270 [Planctomycetota bacterium]|nr:hypothetical protein [Planctomycetota bacterium]MDA1249402.1 hypothetical protein [Planctomycetota bacterium]
MTTLIATLVAISPGESPLRVEGKNHPKIIVQMTVIGRALSRMTHLFA